MTAKRTMYAIVTQDGTPLLRPPNRWARDHAHARTRRPVAYFTQDAARWAADIEMRRCPWRPLNIVPMTFDAWRATTDGGK